MRDVSDLSVKGLQVFWLIGTLERLCTLGYINTAPYRIPSESVDLYTSLKPCELFNNDAEVCELLSSLLKELTPAQYHGNLGDTLRGLSALVLDYKKDPYRIVKTGLETLV